MRAQTRRHWGTDHAPPSEGEGKVRDRESMRSLSVPRTLDYRQVPGRVNVTVCASLSESSDNARGRVGNRYPPGGFLPATGKAGPGRSPEPPGTKFECTQKSVDGPRERERLFQRRRSPHVRRGRRSASQIIGCNECRKMRYISDFQYVWNDDAHGQCCPGFGRGGNETHQAVLRPPPSGLARVDRGEDGDQAQRTATGNRVRGNASRPGTATCPDRSAAGPGLLSTGAHPRPTVPGAGGSDQRAHSASSWSATPATTVFAVCRGQSPAAPQAEEKPASCQDAGRSRSADCVAIGAAPSHGPPRAGGCSGG